MIDQIDQMMLILLMVLIWGIVIAFGLLALKITENKFEKVKKFFKGINNSYTVYINSLKFSAKFCKVLLVIACIFIEVILFLVALLQCCFKEGHSFSASYFILAIVCWCILSFLLYLILGILFVQFSKVIDNISSVRNTDISNKLMISFLLLFLLVLFSFVSENAMRKSLPCLLTGAVICYIFNIQILFRTVQNPFSLVGKNKENEGSIVFNSVLVLLMLVATLYLMVLWAYFSCDSAYYCGIEEKHIITKWDLLYYTVISFTTIGYGDIVPNAPLSQLVAIIISITSVICLVIFVNSVLSRMEKYWENGT